jgi:2-dehydro-3-deoxygalactonokinase
MNVQVLRQVQDMQKIGEPYRDCVELAVMNWQDGYIAVDWGSTNRRAWRLNGTHDVQALLEDDLGILKMRHRDFAVSIEEMRSQLGAAPNVPILMAGMVGSSIGWQEVPYLALPIASPTIAQHCFWMKETSIGIVPGLCQRPPMAHDVMRGEEVQIAGAFASDALRGCSQLCLPGTHGKWVEVTDGRILSFATYMTGELFALLKAHSLLGAQMGEPVVDGLDFRAGLNDGLSGQPLQSALFGVRSRHLLENDNGGGAAYVSGLLIGTEVATACKPESSEAIGLIGHPDLTSLYRIAIEQVGARSIEITGAKAFLAGIAALIGFMQ